MSIYLALSSESLMLLDSFGTPVNCSRAPLTPLVPVWVVYLTLEFAFLSVTLVRAVWNAGRGFWMCARVPGPPTGRPVSAGVRFAANAPYVR